MRRNVPLLQGSWGLREPNLHLGLERKFAPRRGGGAVVVVSPGGQQEERGAGLPGLALNPMPATSWLGDILGYLLPRHTPCQTRGLTLQVSAQDVTVGAGSVEPLDFALSVIC